MNAITSEGNDNVVPNTGTLTRELLETELQGFGRAFGRGQNSRPSAALRCVEAAYKLSDVGPNDAEDLYSKFQNAAAKARGLEYTAESSFKVQVSKLKRFLMLGALPKIDGVDVMNRTCDLISELAKGDDSPLKGSAYDNMVDIARRQIESPDVALTDDEIRSALSEVPEERTHLDKVIDQYKRTYKLAADLGGEGVDVDHIQAAVDALATQIKSMDGDLPPMTKDEKKKMAALKILKDQGVPFRLIKAEEIAQPEEIAQAAE